MIKKIALFVCVLAVLAIASLLIFTRDRSTNSSNPTIPNSAESIVERYIVENKLSEQTSQAFRFALKNPDGLLDKIICYCGCYESGQHQNARGCFINPENERKDTKDIVDPMGANCGLCVKTVIESKRLYEEGKSAQGIRDYIDGRYKRV